MRVTTRENEPRGVCLVPLGEEEEEEEEEVGVLWARSLNRASGDGRAGIRKGRGRRGGGQRGGGGEVGGWRACASMAATVCAGALGGLGDHGSRITDHGPRITDHGSRIRETTSGAGVGTGDRAPAARVEASLIESRDREGKKEKTTPTDLTSPPCHGHRWSPLKT